MKTDDRLLVATIGKVVGLGGDLKLHIESDFTNQFEKGRKFLLDDGKELTIADFDEAKKLIKFENFFIREEAKKLTNMKLYSTKSKSKDELLLKDGEYFWFELEDLEVYEDKQCIGTVTKVDRIAGYDYLLIFASKELQNSLNGPKTFMIPYVDRYIKSVNLESKKIEVIDCVDLYEAS